MRRGQSSQAGGYMAAGPATQQSQNQTLELVLDSLLDEGDETRC